MERRNFFKSLFAAGMVVAAPRILTDNIEPIKEEKVIGIDNIYNPEKFKGITVKHSDIPHCKGRILHKGNLLANFNEVEFGCKRAMIDVSSLYASDEWKTYIPKKPETYVIAHTFNINRELSLDAFRSEIPVQIVILTEDETLIEAEAYIEDIKMNIEMDSPIYSEWALKITGKMTIEQNT